MDNSEIPSTLERILNILGQICLTCRYDTSNKPLCESKSQVLLTQSHSSTLAQELVGLLRTLHGILGWNQVLNAMLMQKLNLAAYLLTDTGMLSIINEGPSADQQHFMISACLNVMGSWDVRPRIGAVMEIDMKQGTVFRVTQKGKLCVQMHNSGEVKKVTLYDLKLIPAMMFNLDRMPFSENLIKTWALLLLSKQYNFYNNQDRKPLYGMYFKSPCLILSLLFFMYDFLGMVFCSMFFLCNGKIFQDK